MLYKCRCAVQGLRSFNGHAPFTVLQTLLCSLRSAPSWFAPCVTARTSTPTPVIPIRLPAGNARLFSVSMIPLRLPAGIARLFSVSVIPLPLPAGNARLFSVSVSCFLFCCDTYFVLIFLDSICKWYLSYVVLHM